VGGRLGLDGRRQAAGRSDGATNPAKLETRSPVQQPHAAAQSPVVSRSAATVAPRILAKMKTPLESSILDDERDARHLAPLLAEANGAGFRMRPVAIPPSATQALARTSRACSPGSRTAAAQYGSSPDSPLEGDGFEPSVPHHNKLCVAPATNVPGRHDPLRLQLGSGCKTELDQPTTLRRVILARIGVWGG
jgi:hypothetical protein